MNLTDREIELIDGMIEVQLNHANRCDTIANRVMAEKQKGWDLERVALLEKVKNTRATDPPEDITGLAHELWALAQLMPEEGILDGVMRIEEALQGKIKGAKDPLLEKMVEALEYIKDEIGSAQYNDVDLYNTASKVLQKYRESKDATK